MPRNFNEQQPPTRFFPKGSTLPFGLGRAASDCVVDLEEKKVVKDQLSDLEARELEFIEAQHVQSLGQGRMSPDARRNLEKHGMI
ncbi:hypothetical protein GEMRC1_011938 [Eukaryota sp. GEM-RC1]